MRNQLPPGEYTCVVISGKVDKEKRGAVPVKVIGVTDDWADDVQPYVYPAISSGMQQVPQKGYYLLVRFKDNDINQGYYYGISSTPAILPAEYVSEYPDVAVMNLGEADYTYTHNRNTHVSYINNPGNSSTVEWDADGFVTLECRNASNEGGVFDKYRGDNVHHVLTEATIDIFTCMPVGQNRSNTGLGQGSEYLSVSHVSQKTIDAFHGNATVEVPKQLKPSDDADNNGTEVRDIVDASGNKVDSVEFHSGKFILVNGERKYRHIILCHSQGENFPKQAKKIMDTNSSVHFLVGKSEGAPEVLTLSEPDSTPKNTGFAQFIDLKNDGGMFSGCKYQGEKASSGAIMVMVVGSVTDGYTDYQRAMVNKLIVHIRHETGNDMLPVITPDNFDNKSLGASMALYTL